MRLSVNNFSHKWAAVNNMENVFELEMVNVSNRKILNERLRRDLYVNKFIRVGTINRVKTPLIKFINMK
ncbi:hypothetical protein CIB95_01890 [Lottiidibacillus patelloidae]|uniref:Uncharacterized protein n=1 Tax=Lottiidibacillus patelloidae TaxID=2670334 RepID=A0A263BX98_9BACI|nr:hypothetical protein CIB95_01890 [Lottiidibacillus patelloidae]